MVIKFTNYLMKIRRLTIVRILQRTLLSLFPIVLVGSYANILSSIVFDKMGYLNNILYLDKWFPFFNQIHILFKNINSFTIGFIAIFSTYFAAKYTAEYYKRQGDLAGITAIFSYFMLSSINIFNFTKNTSDILLNTKWYGSEKMLFGIIIGMIIGQIFKVNPPKIKSNQQIIHSAEILKYSFKSIKGIVLSIVFAIGMNILFLYLKKFNVIDINGVLVTNYVVKNNIISILLYSVTTSILNWMGISSSYDEILDDNVFMKNLNYFIKHHEYTNLPYNYTISTVYRSFGLISGSGGVIALICIMLLFVKNKNFNNIAKSTFIISILGEYIPVMVGIPILFNPIFLIPYILVPLINCIIGMFVIWMGILPPTIFPLMNGTPGVLVEFLGTGGNFLGLLISIIIFIIDCLIYLPFIKESEEIWIKIQKEYQREEKNEK